MAVVLTQGFLLSAEDSVPAWHTRILWQTIARMDNATVSASSNDSEGYVAAPISDQTWEWWRATSLPATWEVDAGEIVTVDAVGIAAHDIGTQGAAVEVQHSDDGASWTAVTGTATSPGKDAPLLILFESIEARYWRIRITGTTPPRASVIYIGKALDMIRPTVWSGHDPGVLSRTFAKRPSESEKGQRLGTTLIRQGFSASYQVNNLPEKWVRDTFDDFVRAAWRYGYFIAWRPEDFPEEVLFGWTDEPITPSNEGGGLPPRETGSDDWPRRMSVSWNMRAHGGYEIGVVPWGST